jgi:hypothetical protein
VGTAYLIELIDRVSLGVCRGLGGRQEGYYE